MPNKIFVGSDSNRQVGIAVTPSRAYVEYLTSDIPNQDMDAPQITTQIGSTPAQKFRQDDKAAMQNPANPYNAALGWIGANAGLAGSALGLASAPLVTTAGTAGDILGQYIGNKASSYIYNNPDTPVQLNTDIKVTPRELTQHGLGFIAGTVGAKGMQKGLTEQVFTNGTETPIVKTRPLSLKVTKYSTIPRSEMHGRNNINGFAKTTFRGVSPEGYYVYTQPKLIMLKNPTNALKSLAKRWIKQGYEKISHPNLEGPAFINRRRNEVLSDFGNNGRNQVGLTIPFLRPALADVGRESIKDFFISMQRKGGKFKK